MDIPLPSSSKSLSQFLGLVNFYHRFLPNAATLLAPLHALVDHKHPHAAITWSDASLSSFQASLSQATLLRHPSPSAPLAIRTDASDTGITVVLGQLEKGEWRPLAFFSIALSPAKQRYSTFDREPLAAFAATQHFQSTVEGRRCVLFTDHCPLTQSVCHSSDPWSPQQQRHLSALTEFLADVQYLPGAFNLAANAQSCSPISSVSFGIDFHDLALHQRDSAVIKTYHTAISNLTLRDVAPFPEGPVLVYDLSLSYP